MTLALQFDWEEATASTTLSNDVREKRSARDFIYPPSKISPRQAAFYRNLIRMAEQTGSRSLPVYFRTRTQEDRRLDFGCIKIAEQAGLILPLSDAASGYVEQIYLAWNPEARAR